MSLINNLLDKISGYIQAKGEKLKLDIIAQVSKLLAHFVAFLLVGLIGFFFFIFGSITLGAYLNEVMESTYLGYLILTGFYLLLLIVIVLLLKTNRIQKWMETFFINLSENMSDE
ncbi:phage holin family protein [Marinoscillum sp. MHG1-6]|uniref:phage holin family protein n=1 Tax=Marinoscillum sp. MHG1-6 TaxID=2959627 RepID=UPI002157E71E|nr:phage holin family protein [Marinoscillum sp. MHG1-6]